MHERDPIGFLELPGKPGSHLLERGREHRADIRDRQRHGVLVLRDHRAVDVPHRRPEQAPEGPPADDIGSGRLDERTRRLQVGVTCEDHLVGDALGDQRPHAVVAQCGAARLANWSELISACRA